MKKIVLTGGPCSGKTSCLKAIEQALGKEVQLVPEAATILFIGGFPKPPAALEDCSHSYYEALQRAILTLQQSMEQACAQIALLQGKRLLVCDRGQLDGAAYWPAGIAAFAQHFQISIKNVNDQYHHVFHLESLATALPDLYGNMSNDQRYEQLELAQKREYATRLAWGQHPNRIFLEGTLPLETKIEQILTVIREHLATPV